MISFTNSILAMKNILPILTILILSSVVTLHAQSFRDADKSPMDQAYFPDNFAHDRKDGEKAIIRVTYSRPAKKEREVFGKLIPYDKVWRTGANENTEIKLYQDVMFGDKKLSAGTYTLFSIPTANDWTIIFSSDLDHWGSYSYKESNDVLRVKAKTTEGKKEVENFAIQFESMSKNSGVMRFAWDKVVVELPFTF
jgi:hypothetical protein